MELSYSLIDKFCNIFENKTLMEKLKICKNIDKYENIIRFFHIRLALFI